MLRLESLASSPLKESDLEAALRVYERAGAFDGLANASPSGLSDEHLLVFARALKAKNKFEECLRVLKLRKNAGSEDYRLTAAVLAAMGPRDKN